MLIVGKSVVLRAIEEVDIPLLAGWANDAVTQDGIGEMHFPSSLDFHQDWFSGLKNDLNNQRLAVEVPEAGIIGITSLMGIDWRNRHAHHGLVLGESGHRGKGYGVDAILATMRFAFDELGLERLNGAMIEYNTASISAYCGDKCGWKEEGRRRNYYYRKGEYWDQIVVGVTRHDYRELVKRTHYWE